MAMNDEETAYSWWSCFLVTWCCRSREIWDLNPAAGRREDLVGKIVFVLEKAGYYF
jgi:hypothetical protein